MNIHNDINKTALIRGSAILLGLMAFVTIATKINQSRQISVSDYANQHPEIAYAHTEETSAAGAMEKSDTDAKDTIDTGAALASDTSTPENKASSTENVSASQAETEAARYNEKIYNSFYYAPLSQEQVNSITNHSYNPELVYSYASGTTAESAMESASESAPESAPESTTEATVDVVSKETFASIGYEDFSYVHILFYDFDGTEQEGELICSSPLADDLLEIFYELYKLEYALGDVSLPEKYDCDIAAMHSANNTYCLLHPDMPGNSVRINPLYNPSIAHEPDSTYLNRSKMIPHKIDETDACYELFTSYGFSWGGDLENPDYGLFYK